jgi:hypothetical protein
MYAFVNPLLAVSVVSILPPCVVLYCSNQRYLAENSHDIFARKFFAEWRREIFQLCAFVASALYKFKSMKIVYLL